MVSSQNYNRVSVVPQNKPSIANTKPFYLSYVLNPIVAPADLSSRARWAFLKDWVGTGWEGWTFFFL